MISIKNFFQEDFNQVVGIYFDGEKIFLSRTNGENIESHFEADEDNFAEQLAEKVLFLCNKQGWNHSKVALCLREEDSITFQPEFENIPTNKIDSAIQSWAVAQVGENALYASAEIDGEFWIEAIPQQTAEKYVSAFEKNSMTLCMMTSLIFSSDKSFEVAKIVAEKKSPNLLKSQLIEWNLKKIFAVVTGIFLILSAIIFGKTYYDLYVATAELENLQKNIAAQEDTAISQENFESNVLESRRLNELLASQIENQKLNTLIKIGQIADDKTVLTKINISENLTEIEGIAENATDVKNYLGRFKSSISRNAKLEKISTENDKVTFKIRLEFEKE